MTRAAIVGMALALLPSLLVPSEPNHSSQPVASQQEAEPDLKSHRRPLDQAVLIEQQLARLSDQARHAIVRVEGTQTEKGQGACTGVIVTADGHLLVSGKLANQKLTVQLDDGREVTAVTRGWSGEWGIALAKLDGNGPWPHVKLNSTARVRAGQAIATFAYSVPDEEIVNRPLIELEWADRSVSGTWFMRSDGSKYEWKLGGVAFDLDGNLIGIECETFPTHGTVFTHAGMVSSFWDDLVSGKNLDEVRLNDSRDADSKPRVAADISNDAERRAIEATVQVRREVGKKGLSGIIVSKDGLVATVAHHFVMPGGRVIISLPDGRDLPGEVVGVSFPSDIGLVRITADGEFPYVEMGHSTRLCHNDACLAIGYGPVAPDSRAPLVRRLQVVEPVGGVRSHLLPLDPSAKFSGGDCGGGIFDGDGKLVAIANPHLGLPWPHENPRIEVLRRQWDSLRVPFEQTAQPEFVAMKKEVLAIAARHHEAVVELRVGDRTVAFGSVVSPQGTIVTKASLLPATGKIDCLLADGRTLPATTIKAVREHDLAVIQVKETNLKSIEWAKGLPAAEGMIAAVAGRQPVFGTVALSAHTFPAERGHLRASFHLTERGLTVREVMADETFTFDPELAPFGPQPLQKGDVLLNVENQPVAGVVDVERLLDVKTSPLAVAGDRVQLLVNRDGQEQTLSLILGPRAWPIGSGQSARCSNFAQVISVATSANVEHLGGPIMNLRGHAIGIAIAARQQGWLLVLPAETVRRFATN